MPEPVRLDIQLEDILTATSCSHLVIEFVKYIAYQRQQIPHPFKHLNAILSKKTALDQSSTVLEDGVPPVRSLRSIQAESEFFKVKESLASMQSTFKHLEDELNVPDAQIVEVAVIIGATPLSPKDVYRLQFPVVHHNHVASKHPHQRHLLQFFRCLIQSEDLHSMFTTNVSPTNLFLFIRKKGNSLATPGFFLKEQYCLPHNGKHCVIKFCAPSVALECICGGINIYCDRVARQTNSEESNKAEEDISGKCKDNLWFQAHNTFKGFKDTKLNGIPVSSLWLQSR